MNIPNHLLILLNTSFNTITFKNNIELYFYKNNKKFLTEFIQNLVNLYDSDFYDNYVFINILLDKYSSYLEYNLELLCNDNIEQLQKSILSINKCLVNIHKSESIINKLLSNKTLYSDLLLLLNKFYNNNKQISASKFINELNIVDNMLNNKDIKKRFINIIIYRYLSSQKLGFNTFNDFFVNQYNININNFISQIPKNKNIVNIIPLFNKYKFKLHVNDIMEFLKSKLSFNITKNNSGYKIIINNNSITIPILKKVNSIQMFNQIPFYSKFVNNIEVNQIIITSEYLNNITDIIQLIHDIQYCIKLSKLKINTITEYNYPIKYDNYFYDTFILFIEFITPSIELYGDSFIEYIKYIYIYSYYDYYFYYTNSFLDLLVKKNKDKYFLFDDLTSNIKNSLNLPTECLSYPPFFPNLEDDDINFVLYYQTEIPNYYKFYDLIRAINDSNNTKLNVNNIIDILNQFTREHKKKPTVNNSDVLNSYIEIKDDKNCIFNSEIY